MHLADTATDSVLQRRKDESFQKNKDQHNRGRARYSALGSGVSVLKKRAGSKPRRQLHY